METSFICNENSARISIILQIIVRSTWRIIGNHYQSKMIMSLRHRDDDGGDDDVDNDDGND